MQASLRPIGSKWLLERSGGHASEGTYSHEADALMCDLPAKLCGAFTMPPDVEP